MAPLSSCPACNTTLGLFTPREISRHINACLDAQPHQPPTPQTLPRCPICQRDLTSLTLAARAEHQNRCLDNLNPPPPKKPSPSPAPAHHQSPPKPVPEDKRLRRFLELLGLERYASRFEAEEVDFPGLRLLEDKDFTHLRIPDAARRRIADALTAVPILAQIDGPHVNQPVLDPALVPTQRFGTSRLAHQMPRNKPMVQLDDSDGEYAPTPTVNHSASHERPASDRISKEQNIDQPEETVTPDDTRVRLSSEELNFFEEIEQIVKSRQGARASESSDVSSFASDPNDLRELLPSISQITVELKLRKWRRKQLEKENNRHARELRRIETEYTRLLNVAKIPDNRQHREEGVSPELPNVAENNCETIDLTEDMSGKENAPEASAAKVSSGLVFEKSIVISSNESVPNAPSIQQNDRTQGKVDSRIEEAHTSPKNIRRPESPLSETRTPEQTKKNTGSEDEVINLISSEKKRGSEQPFKAALSQRVNNVAPLFPSSPGQDDIRGSQQNPDDSDEDFMDLIGVGKENTRSSSQPTRAPEDANKRSSTECDSSSTEEGPSQSRLKKRPKRRKRVKATSQDISQLIRMDKALYEEILLMDSVSFDRILSRVRRGQNHVTKKALYSFLQNEGIIFKGDAVESGSQQELYLRHLNSDKCPD